MDPYWMEYPMLLLLCFHAKVVLMSQGFAVQARLRAMPAACESQAKTSYVCCFQVGRAFWLLVRNLPKSFESWKNHWRLESPFLFEIKYKRNWKQCLCKVRPKNVELSSLWWQPFKNKASLASLKWQENTVICDKANVKPVVFYFQTPALYRCFDWTPAKYFFENKFMFTFCIMIQKRSVTESMWASRSINQLSGASCHVPLVFYPVCDTQASPLCLTGCWFSTLV